MIPVADTKIWGNELKYLKDCVKTGWFSSLGKYVKLLEEKFSSAIGCKHGIACTNGTSGLFTALRVLNIGSGDEVIIPDFTIIVSANAVILNGARPVLVDVEPDTFCLNPDKIEAAISKKTKAIMVVHMYGHPADMGKINAIAKKYNLYVIEDCCQSHGARYKNKYTGSLSDISVFSFYANKILTCGEGGMMLTNKKKLAERLRLFVDNGFEKPRFKHKTIGFNFRMSNLQAAVGLAQAEHLKEAVIKKRKIAKKYIKGLKDFTHITLPIERSNVKNVYWMFGILINKSLGIKKEKVIALFKSKGIETRSFFYSMHQQPIFKNAEDPRFPDIKGNWPVSEDLSLRGLYLPSGLGLTNKEINYCIETLKSFSKNK